MLAAALAISSGGGGYSGDENLEGSYWHVAVLHPHGKSPSILDYCE